MKNQVDYFEKVIKILKDLKKDYPDIEVSKHYSLATDCSNFSLSDKELYHTLQKHKSELDMNTLSDKDFDKIIKDTDELFKEVEPEDEEDQWEADWEDK
jgi:lipoate-protein ligase A